MTAGPSRRARRWRLVAPVVALAVVAALVLPAGVAGAGVPPPADGAQACAEFAALQQTIVSFGPATTPKETFASIHQTTRVFRRVARSAPEAIADDMQLLAVSMTALDRKLASVASGIRPAQSRQQLDRMLEDIRQAFADWTQSQDVDALGAAQSAVDDWLEATCGFRLGVGDSGSEGTVASCASPEAAVAAVLAGWKAGDQAGAQHCGAAAAVTELFSLPAGVALTDAGCTGVDSTTVDCSYRYEGGSLTLTVTRAGTGWKVSGVTGRPD